jgi:hypothetical protein
MIMKKTLIAFLIFVCFGTPCFGMEAASLFSIESTEWDLGEGFSIGFYQSSMYFCDATCCKHFSGAYEKVSFRGARCISTGSCAAVSGLVFPLWGIGVMPTCVDNICESGLIVKTRIPSVSSRLMPESFLKQYAMKDGLTAITVHLFWMTHNKSIISGIFPNIASSNSNFYR